MVNTNTPLVSIVLATYRPDPEYFRKQLKSLDGQNYKELELVVVDDSASKDEYDEVRAYLEKHVKRIPYRLYRNERNLGSVKTFEEAVRQAKGEYLAFCDQDDIWYPEKIERLLQEIQKQDALLVHSDMQIIDGTDAVTHKSVAKKNRRILPMQGDDLFSFFIKRNAVTGCSMMVAKELALMAMPYPDEWYHHDQWLALWASDKGRIAYVEEPLLGYRIHGKNQVGLRMLEGIGSRDDYIGKLEESIRRMEFLLDMFPEQLEDVEREIRNLRARSVAFKYRRFFKQLKNKKAYGDDHSLRWFEALYSVVPSWIGRIMLYVIRRI